MHAGDIGLGPSPHDLSPPLPPPPPASLQPALPPAPLPDLARKMDPRPMPLHALPATQHHNFCQCWAFLKLLVLCPGKYTDLSTHPQGSMAPAMPSRSLFSAIKKRDLEWAKVAQENPHSGPRGANLPQGTSWLELFCAFFCLGGSLSTQAGGGAAPKPSLRLQLVLFKRIVLLVSKVALSEGDRRFLVPSKSTMCRLKGMGFCNHVACISGEALFDDQLRTQVTLGLLSLRMSVTLRVKQSLRTGNLWIKPTKVSYRGTPAWERMGRLSSCVPNETHAAVSSESHVQAFSRLASVFFAVCPRCHAPRDTTRITLMRHGMWVSITCVECSFTASSRKWDCLCGKLWHACPKHAERGFACRTPAKRHAESIPGKRGASNLEPVPSLLATQPKARRLLVCTAPKRGFLLQTGSATKRVKPFLSTKRKAASDQEEALAAVDRLRALRAASGQGHHPSSSTGGVSHPSSSPASPHALSSEKKPGWGTHLPTGHI